MLSPAFALRDPRTDTEYQLYIHAPARPPAGGLPAVLFLDGDDQFEAAVSAYRSARRARRVPPLLLAGIGYGASYTRPGNRRVRDYTPTAMPTEHGSGGADDFLGFLRETLWPDLIRRFAVRDDVRGIGGHSLGSLFVVHAGFQRRPFFNRLLASAPSLWWDDRAVLRAIARRQETGAELPARLFLSVGTEDTPSMTGDLALLEGQLAGGPLPRLEIVTRRFTGRDHYNVLGDAFRAGLEALYGGRSP